MRTRRTFVLVVGLVALAVPARAQTGVPRLSVPPPARDRPSPTSVASPSPTSAPQELAPRPAPPDQLQFVTPNGKLLWASGIVFGAAYLPSLVVAITSSHDADRYLYIPVAGPWIDLVIRDCAEPAVRCPDSALNGVGLFLDGLFQLAGLVGFVLAFRVPEARWVPPARPAVFPGGHLGIVVTLSEKDQLGSFRW